MCFSDDTVDELPGERIWSLDVVVLCVVLLWFFRSGAIELSAVEPSKDSSLLTSL